MTIQVTRPEDLGFDLPQAVADHLAALAAHAHSVGEPAPVAHPLVEMIVASGGAFEIIETPEPPAPNPIDEYRRAVQQHVDATAQQRAYDSGVTCSSYVNSTNPDWAAQAATFIAWRDAVWSYAFTELAKVEGGARPQPSVAEILAELPTMVWPSA